eukprot:scaffold50620_cov45-Phaeocystis_antarctica.AAC.1
MTAMPATVPTTVAASAVTASVAAVATTAAPAAAAATAVRVGPSVGGEGGRRARRGGRAAGERHRQRAPHLVLVVDLDTDGAQLLTHLVGTVEVARHLGLESLGQHRVDARLGW